MDYIQNMSEFVAIEGIGSFVSRFRDRKKAPVAADPAKSTVYDTEYRPKLQALAYEIAEDAKRSKLGTYDHMEFFTKDCGYDTVSRTGAVGIAIYHWQGYERGDRPDVGNVSDDESLTDAAMSIVERELRSIAKKYARKAAAIHPKCSVKVGEGDVDRLYLDFEKAWVNNS